MKYALCVKLCQHDFIIVMVHKLLVHGHCSESGLHSLLSRSSRCPRANLFESIKVVIGSFLKIGKLAQHHSAARVRVDFESQTSYMP